ncbi:MAG: pirin-like C-terminal cupin domain-containing protein [Cytophagales bacterium]
MEETSPSFTHIPSEDIPKWNDGNLSFKLIAGKAFDRESPVPVYSPLYFIEIESKEETKVSIGDKLYGESAMYILNGYISSEGNEYGSKQILIAKDTKLCEFNIAANSTVYIFGGEPFPEDRYIDWNFVSSRKERLAKAKEDWMNQNFPKISGETDFVPYPTKKIN